MDIIIASANKHKIEEFQKIFADRFQKIPRNSPLIKKRADRWTGWQSSSLLCIQSLYLHKPLYLLNSIILSLISLSVIPLKSRELNPGVSATKPPSKLNNSVCLVVCLPLFKALLISFVFKLKSLFNLFNKLDLPLPLCPVNTVTLSLNIFFIFKY